MHANGISPRLLPSFNTLEKQSRGRFSRLLSTLHPRHGNPFHSRARAQKILQAIYHEPSENTDTHRPQRPIVAVLKASVLEEEKLAALASKRAQRGFVWPRNVGCLAPSLSRGTRDPDPRAIATNRTRLRLFIVSPCSFPRAAYPIETAPFLSRGRNHPR